jgi:flagellar motor switch protein FliG
MSLEDLKNKKEQKLIHPYQKVAALLIALGPNTASEILKNITDKDLLEQITLNIANVGKLPDDTVTDVLEEFKVEE